jgi:hypothetical protein
VNNVIPLMRRETCQITVWAMERFGKGGRHKCGAPLKVGERFCEKHEADRIRLTQAQVDRHKR